MVTRVIQKPEPSRIAAIDGLRALAMTAVIAQHCGLAPMGWTGVWLFYVVSGFVITRIFEGNRGQPSGAQYRRFIRRRFFRIVPAYGLYIAVNVLVMLAVSQPTGLRDLPFLFTFTYNWQMIFQLWPTPDGWSAFGHLWTLSVEEQFYIVFPVLFLLLPRRGFVLVATALVIVAPLTRLLFAALLPVPVQTDLLARAFAVYAASITQFDAFLMGALLALGEPALRRRPWIAGALVAVALCAVAAYAGAMILVNRAGGATGIDLLRNIFSGILAGDGREALVYSVIDLAGVALLASALAFKRFGHVLAWAPLSFVGRVSYGGYLIHLLALWCFGHLFAGHLTLSMEARVALFALTWLTSVALAALSYRWFEAPLMAWARRREPREARQPSARAVTASIVAAQVSS